ncbi:glutathione S-transferase C-terminal domain-containing protein [Actinoallomurus oryzae]|uniref:Glutathione S-transferase C-terminal domain-containing protein n=1 Tax=Actinoallomurus oryzae TaxID=502180 RepID=A0ABP8QHH3_9ACTN
MANIMSAELKNGRFVRQANRFTDRIGTDEELPVETGRYQLYASLACPWAHRSLIVRRLLGLEDVIGVTIVDPIRDERGWRFTLSPDGRDPVTGARFLAELYTATDPSYEGRHTVPCVWDTVGGRLVTNDYPQITLTLESAFAPFHRPGAPELYPQELRAEIDAVNDEVFHNVNNGVYEAGMAQTQEAYEEAFDALFATLDRLEARLDSHDYLVGDRLTEADVRLYPTLARFDAVYHGHFKCNLRRIVDYPRLWAYARRLYAIPAFGETTDFDHIKRHYYETHRHLNPYGIVAKGPAISWT